MQRSVSISLNVTALKQRLVAPGDEPDPEDERDERRSRVPRAQSSTSQLSRTSRMSRNSRRADTSEYFALSRKNDEAALEEEAAYCYPI